MKKETHKVQSNIEGYTLFVLRGLIGIQGRSVSDVVSSILKLWIHQNREVLESYDLGVKDWKEEGKK